MNYMVESSFYINICHWYFYGLLGLGAHCFRMEMKFMSDFFKKYSKTRGEDHVQGLQLEGVIAAQIKTNRQKLKMSQQELSDLTSVPNLP